MVEEAQIVVDAPLKARRPYRLLIAVLLAGIGIGYALGAIQTWVFW